MSGRVLLAALPLALVGASASAVSSAPDRETDPLRFFEGKTESISTIKVIMRKPYRSRTLGEGEIGSDGVLDLVQRVHQDGQAPYERKWRMRKLNGEHFTGTMSEAVGPVSVEKVGASYRFRFKLKGSLSVEQWLIPLPGGNAAKSRMSVRKFGMKVGTSEGTIRKL